VQTEIADTVKYSITSWGSFDRFESRLVPHELLTRGVHVGRDGSGERVRIWLHKTGKLPNHVTLSFVEAQKFSRLLMVASEGSVSSGSVWTVALDRVEVFARRRGSVVITANTGRSTAHLSRQNAQDLASQIRQIACDDIEQDMQFFDSLLASIE
jgi:hypothetical protein